MHDLAKDYLTEHLATLGQQLSQIRQQANAHLQEAAKLNAMGDELQQKHTQARAALESLGPSVTVSEPSQLVDKPKK